MTTVAIIDSGGANIASLVIAFERLQAKAVLTTDAAVIRNAGPGFTTRPAWPCNQDAAATDWKLASATVP